MSGLRGNPAKLSQLAGALRKLPTRLAQTVAGRVAPAISARAASAYSSGRTVYGDARPLGVQGNALTLMQSGRTQSLLRFVAVGTIVRCVLGTRYAKYLIGKYRILPMGSLPITWQQEIGDVARQEIRKGLTA